MSSSDQEPQPAPVAGSDGPTPPGKAMTLERKLIDEGAQILQSKKPVSQMKQHLCSFALYGHDPCRQIEAHHYAARLNEEVLQCAVYDSDSPSARLIGVEYIVSEAIFEKLPAEEQKLWHSHAYAIKSGALTCPGVPEVMQRQELKGLAKTYGKFWCTWQVDRGDRLPLGAPALMMSMQTGMAQPEMVKRRDEKYEVSSEALKESRKEMPEPEKIHPNADYWKLHGKGFAVDVVQMDMNSPPALAASAI
ncbi:oil body-associated protein 2B [Canna indica]|uniref:Oil body-associated protein 2B n=1 Tax=Canna indica TaxID=4628 RepID=A0AAQ3JVD2_9LILI|nr:oil body-associated protein 2B [Canna indica]